MSILNKSAKKSTSYLVVKKGSSTSRPPLSDAYRNGKDERKDKKETGKSESE